MGLSSLFTASLLTASALVADAAPCINSTGSKPIAATYFAGYHVDDGFTVDDLSWEKYNVVAYAFA